MKARLLYIIAAIVTSAFANATVGEKIVTIDYSLPANSRGQIVVLSQDGDTYRLAARPNAGYVFLFWVDKYEDGDIVTNTDSVRNYTINPQQTPDVSLTAVFGYKEDIYQEAGVLNVEPFYNGPSPIWVYLYPQVNETCGELTGNWWYGTSKQDMSLDEYDPWGYSNMDAPRDTYVGDNVFYQPVFTIPVDELVKEGDKVNGHIDVNTIDCQTYLTAVPDEGYEFANWADNGAPTTAERKIAYNAEGDYTAYFNEKIYDIDLYDNNATATQEVLTAKQGKTVNATVHRTLFCDGYYNTLCLPFSLSSLEGTPLEGGTLMTYTGADIYDNTIDVHIEDATEIEAGKPYLIMFPEGENIVNPVFEEVLLTAPASSSIEATGMDFVSTYVPYQLQASEDYLFVGAENGLYWPASNSNPLKGFRAYFVINDQQAGAPIRSGMRAQFVTEKRTPTFVEQTPVEGQVEKYLEKENLIIMRNGVCYDALGRQLKK